MMMTNEQVYIRDMIDSALKPLRDEIKEIKDELERLRKNKLITLKKLKEIQVKRKVIYE
jgi:hypothetical protein